MAKVRKQAGASAEIEAIGAVHAALEGLDASVQLRVLRYCAEMLGLALESASKSNEVSSSYEPVRSDDSPTTSTTTLPDTDVSEDVDGINAVALKWIRRSGLNTKELQNLFSLGIEEIDLVAKSVPGSSKRERMHNVVLLKGIAAYLGSGTPRMTYEQLKEACLHYNAYDMGNFASYLRSFSADAGGTKEAGYTLSARGLNSATELIKQMLGPKQ